MPNCSQCNRYMILSPNYFGNHPKCHGCRSTPVSMVFSDEASPIADFWEEQERNVQVADATVHTPVIASSYAEIGSDAATAVAAAAAPAEPEANYSDDPCSRINVGGYVYILFDAASAVHLFTKARSRAITLSFRNILYIFRRMRQNISGRFIN